MELGVGGGGGGVCSWGESGVGWGGVEGVVWGGRVGTLVTFGKVGCCVVCDDREVVVQLCFGVVS